MLIIYIECFSDPLPRAVYLAYKARKAVIINPEEKQMRNAIRQCDRSGRLLRESLKLAYTEENSSIVKVWVAKMNVIMAEVMHL